MAETMLSAHIYCRQCQTVWFQKIFMGAEKLGRSTVFQAEGAHKQLQYFIKPPIFANHGRSNLALGDSQIIAERLATV